MTDAPAWIRADGRRLLLEVHATPRASRTRVAGVHGGRLKVQLAAPPVDGAANAELERFLAAELGVPRAAVEIAAGHGGRRKTVVVSGLGLEAAMARLDKYASSQ